MLFSHTKRDNFHDNVVQPYISPQSTAILGLKANAGTCFLSKTGLAETFNMHVNSDLFNKSSFARLFGSPF